jgi:5'-nucleotidase
MRILLTNDDGIEAPGLLALHRAIADLGKVHVIAPSKVQSATSHAVTFHRPIAVRPAGPGLAVDGRPADCVKLGLSTLIGEPIDLVISGMNAGANVGINVLYSGTVGAAREGGFCGVPAIAVSLHMGEWDIDHWDRAAVHARTAINAVLKAGLDAGTIANINVPILDGGKEPKGLAVRPASTGKMVLEYRKDTDSQGDATYQISNTMTFAEREPGTDVAALYDGYITITPLHAETTCHATTRDFTERMEQA